MTVKMTKRDKLLVYIMVIVLVLFGFIWFVIFPQIELSGTLDSTMNDLEGKKLPMEAAVMSLDSMKNTYEESIVDLDGALNDFYPYMQNYEIDKMFTGLLVDSYGLTVTNLSMTSIPAGVAVPPYMAAYSEAEEDTGGEENTGEIDAQSIPVVTSGISITAQGEISGIQSLLDDLFNNYPSIRITGYSITDSGTLTLNCDLYMKAGTPG